MSRHMRFSGWCRQSPRKMRLVVDLIRGKDVNEAYAILQFNKKHAAKQIAKTLKSAVANAEQKAQRANEPFDVDAARTSTKAIVNEGQPLKRFTAAAQGRAHPDPEAHQPRGDPRGRARRRTNGTEDASDRVPARHRQARGRRAGSPSKDMPALLKEDELIRKYLQHAAGPRGDRRRSTSSGSRARSPSRCTPAGRAW